MVPELLSLAMGTSRGTMLLRSEGSAASKPVLWNNNMEVRDGSATDHR